MKTRRCYETHARCHGATCEMSGEGFDSFALVGEQVTDFERAARELLAKCEAEQALADRQLAMEF